MATYTPAVRTIANGQEVEASVANAPVQDLTERTDWLKEQVTAASAGTQLVLRSQTVPAATPIGTPLYYDTVSQSFKAAIAAVDSTTFKGPAGSALIQGLLLSIAGTSGVVCLAGSLTQTTVAWAALFETGVFASGPIYLSALTAGKLTTAPGTLGIRVGTLFPNGTMLIEEGQAQSFLDHVHLQRTILGKPAGTVVDPVLNAPQVITTPNSSQQGWLPANSTYFPGYVAGVQIPTGAKFGYNINHASETALREIFPMVPADNAQFSQTGLVLYSSLVTTNQYGIWWMDDSYGNAPWPVDYNATSIADAITVWTSRLIAQQDIIAAITNDVSAAAVEQVAALVTTRVAADTGVEVTGTLSDVDGAFGKVTVKNTGVVGALLGFGVHAFTPATGVVGNDTTPAAGNLRFFGVNPQPMTCQTQIDYTDLGSINYSAANVVTPGPTMRSRLSNTAPSTAVFKGDPIGGLGVPGVPVDLIITLRLLVGYTVGVAATYQSTASLTFLYDKSLTATVSTNIQVQYDLPLNNSAMVHTVQIRVAAGTFKPEWLPAVQMSLTTQMTQGVSTVYANTIEVVSALCHVVPTTFTA